jgi:plasmid stability protein
MPQLLVRNLPRSLVEALKLRAGQHGRSAEAEHREILREALARRPRGSFKQYLLSMPKAGTDADFEIPRSRARRVVL